MDRLGKRTGAFVIAVALATVVMVVGAAPAAACTALPNYQLNVAGGKLKVGNLSIPLNVPECADGIDNDNNGDIDMADAKCVLGPFGEPDCSEFDAGWQDCEQEPKSWVEVEVDDKNLIEVVDAWFKPITRCFTVPLVGNECFTFQMKVAGSQAGVLHKLDFDKDHGEIMALGVSIAVNITSTHGGFTPCSIGPVGVSFDGALIGGTTITTAVTGVNVPAITPANACGFFLLFFSWANALNTAIGLPDNNASIDLVFKSKDYIDLVECD